MDGRAKTICSEWSHALIHVEKHRAKVHVHLERVPRLLSTHLQVRHTVREAHARPHLLPPPLPPAKHRHLYVRLTLFNT